MNDDWVMRHFTFWRDMYPVGSFRRGDMEARIRELERSNKEKSR